MMESINKVEYNLRSLSTRSVTLFPTSAQVFRYIKDVRLQPGTNEVTIYGLSPTVDEQSIKVDGSGSVIISDIVVESLPNRDIFEHVYPESDDGTSDDGQESDSEEPEFPESAALVDAKARRRDIEDRLKAAEESITNADTRRKALENYVNTLTAKDCSSVEDSINSYRKARMECFEDWESGTGLVRELSTSLSKADNDVSRLLKTHEREKAKATKGYHKTLAAKSKARAQEARRKSEEKAEKERIKKEKQKFWPKYCYAVRIQLEASSFTPSSSRRGSISSDTEVVDLPESPILSDRAETVTTCNLVLSYVTNSAYWSPSYDLQLSTMNATGTLCFDAQLNNTTSETWEKCKVTLSTSQTSSTGLDDTAPVLLPWRIKLSQGGVETHIVQSRDEMARKAHRKSNMKNTTTKPRSEMFGVDPDNLAPADYQMQLMMLEQQNKKRMMMARREHPNPQANPSALFGSSNSNSNTNTNTNAFVAAPYPPPAPSKPSQGQQMYPIQQQQQAQQLLQMQQSALQQRPNGSDNLDSGFMMESESISHDQQQQNEPQLDFEESLVEETGFTTTYDLPSLKTLAPKSSTSKQRIARINFHNILFSHTVVAKYTPVAHLSAKLQNMSRLTLLRGPVGVTLDGSFMGRTTLPRCAAGGESVSLSLGVDPAIKVSYATPSMQRASVGFFTKEDIKVYDRSIRLENTRATTSKHVKLQVHDQIPVSSDEKVKVELHEPKGLVPEGDSKPAGEAGRTKDKDDWGTADARLKKDGEVTWLVALRPGRSVKLDLQYTISTPIGNYAVGE